MNVLYRAHFPYSTPEGCRDEPCEYYYDLILTKGRHEAIVLALEKDAPFALRGIRINTDADSTREVAVQIRDALGKLLSDDTLNVKLYAEGAGFSGNFQGGMAVPLDDEILLPPGAVLETNWDVQ